METPVSIPQTRTPPTWRETLSGLFHQTLSTCAGDLTRRVAASEAHVNHNPCAVADRLWVKHRLDPKEKKLRFSN